LIALFDRILSGVFNGMMKYARFISIYVRYRSYLLTGFFHLPESQDLVLPGLKNVGLIKLLEQGVHILHATKENPVIP
jgi:hypothetical protein